MNKKLLPGSIICQKFDINPMALAKMCDHNTISAYSDITFSRILPSNQCETKFKFKFSPILFYINPNYEYETIAISHSSSKYMDILINNSVIDSNNNETLISEINIEDNSLEFNKRIYNYSKIFNTLKMKNIKPNTIKYKSKKYILYVQHSHFLGNKPIPVKNFSFMIHDLVYEMIFECLFILKMRSSRIYIPWSTKISCKDISSSIEKRKCVDKCDFSKIEFYTDFRVCEKCGMDINYNNIEQDSNYRERYNKYSIYKQQRELIYSDPVTGRELRHGEDFFKFNINEFRFGDPFADLDIVTKNFNLSISKMLFNLHEVKKLFINRSEEIYNVEKNISKEDIKEFIINLITDKIKSGELNDKDKEALNVYLYKVKGYTNSEVYLKFHPKARAEDAKHLRSFASQRIKKCKDIFKRLKITYIKWGELLKNNFSEEERDSIIKKYKKLNK